VRERIRNRRLKQLVGTTPERGVGRKDCIESAESVEEPRGLLVPR
jgi:hypothetical protein